MVPRDRGHASMSGVYFKAHLQRCFIEHERLHRATFERPAPDQPGAKWRRERELPLGPRVIGDSPFALRDHTVLGNVRRIALDHVSSSVELKLTARQCSR